MCLIAYAWKAHPHWPLVLIGNRDEFHARPTAAADWHEGSDRIYGGRDLEAGGSWLLVSASHRLAAVTNVRVGLPAPPAARSRGRLVDDFVRAAESASAWLDALSSRAMSYGRFNLLLWDGSALALASNHPRFEVRPVPPGVHALSNGPLDAQWPKMGHASAALGAWIEATEAAQLPDTSVLFAALAHDAAAADDRLPDTGVGIERERQLSPAFIRGAHYGTRSSSVVVVGPDAIAFEERRFLPLGQPQGRSTMRIPLR